MFNPCEVLVSVSAKFFGGCFQFCHALLTPGSMFATGYLPPALQRFVPHALELVCPLFFLVAKLCLKFAYAIGEINGRFDVDQRRLSSGQYRIFHSPDLILKPGQHSSPFRYTTKSSPCSSFRMTLPSASRLRAKARISCWAPATSRARTGPITSMSSFSMSAAREDIAENTCARKSSCAPRSASASC